MYYIFTEHWAGTKAIFDNKEKCDRFVKDFLHRCIEEDGECPQKDDDYSIFTLKTINPKFEEWYNEFNED